MDELLERRKNVSPEELEAKIRLRIGYDLEFYRGKLPREVAVSWSGYIQAVGEWSPAARGSVIGRLRAMLPDIPDDPSEADNGKHLPA